jgi:hypothetical protein
MGTSKAGVEIMSKGSAPRPKSIDIKTFDSNWDRIFGKKKTQEVKEKKDQKEKKDASKNKRG